MGKHHKQQKTNTLEHKGKVIRERSPGHYQVDFMIDGTRKRKSFKTLEAAKKYINFSSSEIRAKGTDALRISDSMRVELTEVMKKLNGRATLTEVAAYWLERHPEGEAETWSQAADRYLAAMTTNQRRTTSVTDKRLKYQILGKALSNPVMQAVDKNCLNAAVTQLASGRGWSDQTKNKYLSAGLTLIEFFKGNSKQMRKKDEAPPVVWTADFITTVMSLAEEHVPRFVPALAIMTFAGIRPNEALRLTWDAVNFNDGHISLTGKETKTHTTRHVTITPNLLAWLTAYKGTGNISTSPTSQRYDREKLMGKLKITEWPNDVLRHTAATMMYAQSKDVNTTCEQLGHFGGTGMFLRHYKGLAPKPEEVTKFWSIIPQQKTDNSNEPKKTSLTAKKKA
jgi:integrase